MRRPVPGPPRTRPAHLLGDKGCNRPLVPCLRRRGTPEILLEGRGQQGLLPPWGATAVPPPSAGERYEPQVAKGSEATPRYWAVERIFCWSQRGRRPARDHEPHPRRPSCARALSVRRRARSPSLRCASGVPGFAAGVGAECGERYLGSPSDEAEQGSGGVDGPMRRWFYVTYSSVRPSISSRSWCRPRRAWLLTVPRGIPVKSEI